MNYFGPCMQLILPSKLCAKLIENWSKQITIYTLQQRKQMNNPFNFQLQHAFPPYICLSSRSFLFHLRRCSVSVRSRATSDRKDLQLGFQFNLGNCLKYIWDIRTFWHRCWYCLTFPNDNRQPNLLIGSTMSQFVSIGFPLCYWEYV